MTIDQLRTYGANVEEGLGRCLGMEPFYLGLVADALKSDRFDDLETALSAKDFKQAFEIVHGLKGMYANLALTPLLNPVSEMTELLRAGTDTDYTALLQEARAQYRTLCALEGEVAG